MTPKLTPKAREHLKETANRFMKSIKEIVDSCLLLEDVEMLHRLVNQVYILRDHEVLKGLREKGFEKDIMELCEEAGRREIEK